MNAAPFPRRERIRAENHPSAASTATVVATDAAASATDADRAAEDGDDGFHLGSVRGVS